MPKLSVFSRHPLLSTSLALGLGLFSAVPADAAVQARSGYQQPVPTSTQLWGHLDRSIVEQPGAQHRDQALQLVQWQPSEPRLQRSAGAQGRWAKSLERAAGRVQ